MANLFNKNTGEYLKSVNESNFDSSDWYINPDTTAVAGIDKKYWKPDVISDVGGGWETCTLIEMSTEEKADADCNIIKLKLSDYVDYIAYYEAIHARVMDKTFAGLSIEEKEMACDLYAVRDADGILDAAAIIGLYNFLGLTQEQATMKMLSNRMIHIKKFTEACIERYYKVQEILPLYMSVPDEMADMLKIIKPLADLLITYGIRGKEYWDVEDGIMDWVESTNHFAATGLAEQVYTYNAPFTDAHLIGHVNDILINGNY